jgi:hypothetical protein
VSEKFIKKAFRAVETYNNNPLPGSYTAIRQQMGLKLQEEKLLHKCLSLTMSNIPPESRHAVRKLAKHIRSFSSDDLRGMAGPATLNHRSNGKGHFDCTHVVYFSTLSMLPSAYDRTTL